MSRSNASRRRASLVLVGVAAALSLSACASPGSSSPSDTGTASVEIDTATPAGEKAQWIVDLLNADEDTTVAEWEPELHESFVAEVSSDELVDLLNTDIRPAAPYTVTGYEDSGTQSVTTLESDVVDPMNMSVTLDDAGQIVGLWFGPTSAG
ncbi:Cpe/LpqF family protein [Microbacterium betulae]|uniref:Cpe/LpqF family protein n=1 Tax=Microbacterium betulae TaxID=2981139 RepID=A0AA97I5G8_9MICO|nr:Cpe/LpqF family protein [Microbacterium sp. AB]WOF21480.1 Cpe/LpqF family protein [Microbacterium sp. AB]